MTQTNHQNAHHGAANPRAQGPLPGEDVESLRLQWETIQAGFVDDPRNAVAEADVLVKAAVRRVAENFEQRRAALEETWSSGQQPSTEELRRVLQGYRNFFQRVLSAAPPETDAP